MKRKLAIRAVRSAADQITAASRWWDENRPKAPGAFREEMERAFELISVHPQIGARANNAKLAGVRRVCLHRIHYCLYYRVDASGETVDVLALWHTSRGSGPDL